MAEKWLSFGMGSFDPSAFEPVRNSEGSFFTKPAGGLWASEYRNETGNHSDWERWSAGEEFRLDRLNSGVTFSLSDDARILTVSSREDYLFLLDEYGRSDPRFPERVPDWEAISSDFDAFVLTSDGERENSVFGILDSDDRSHRHENLSGWDVPSLVVLNPDVVENPEPFRNDTVYVSDVDSVADAVAARLNAGWDGPSVEIGVDVSHPRSEWNRSYDSSVSGFIRGADRISVSIYGGDRMCSVSFVPREKIGSREDFAKDFLLLIKEKLSEAAADGRAKNPDLMEAVASRIEAKLEEAERTGEDLEAFPSDEADSADADDGADPADADDADFSNDDFDSDSAVDSGL